jgi:hypothetical protein
MKYTHGHKVYKEERLNKFKSCKDGLNETFFSDCLHLHNPAIILTDVHVRPFHRPLKMFNAQEWKRETLDT